MWTKHGWGYFVLTWRKISLNGKRNFDVWTKLRVKQIR